MTRDQITKQLLDDMWEAYCDRVPYAKTYAKLVTAKGGQVINDHCAFRTLNTNTGDQKPGYSAITEVLEALGYEKVSAYAFPSKHLNSLHYQHPTEKMFPKFFVTQLEVAELPKSTQFLIEAAVGETEDNLKDRARLLLARVKAGEELNEVEADSLVEDLYFFFMRSWPAPPRATVLAVNEVSQFGAWTLLHGNAVNHYTAYINFQNVPEWPDIEATMAGLAEAGVPIKPNIEGAKGSKLRQSSTQAVDENVQVLDPDGTIGYMKWSYAYYELAERNFIEENGEKVWFDGFLGEQATNLFEMTKR